MGNGIWFDDFKLQCEGNIVFIMGIVVREECLEIGRFLEREGFSRSQNWLLVKNLC